MHCLDAGHAKTNDDLAVSFTLQLRRGGDFSSQKMGRLLIGGRYGHDPGVDLKKIKSAAEFLKKVSYSPANDWALIKLDESLPGVLNYPLLGTASPTELIGAELIALGYPGMYGSEVPVRSNDCRMIPSAGSVRLACMATPGMSGGPIVRRFGSGQVEIVGVVAQEQDDMVLEPLVGTFRSLISADKAGTLDLEIENLRRSRPDFFVGFPMDGQPAADAGRRHPAVSLPTAAEAAAAFDAISAP